MSLSRKNRSTANPHVGALQYVAALRAAQAGLKLQNADDVAPELASERRHVRPNHIMLLSKVLHCLMDKGCTSCVAFPFQFEMAVASWLGRCELSENCAFVATTWANKMTTHVQACFAQLRTLVSEQQSGQTAKMKYMKTLPFRKICTPAHWVVLEALMDRVDLSPPWGKCVELADDNEADITQPHLQQLVTPKKQDQRELQITPVKVDRSQFGSPTIEVDDMGFPTIFQVASKCASVSSVASADSQIAAPVKVAPCPMDVPSF